MSGQKFNSTDNSLGLSNQLLQALGEMGYSQMTPIQAACIPVLLSGQDLIGQSKTGSGKTAAFVIPILQKINISIKQPQALILCPTRELCDQVLRECQKFSKYYANLKIVSLVGGQPYPPQNEALIKGVHLIIGTPGRTLEHLTFGQVNLSQLKTFVLDEADRLLDDGFADEMNAIIDLLPKKRQTVFFSATFSASIETLSQQHQVQAKKISINESAPDSVMIQQYLYAAEKPQKIETLMQILQQHPAKCALIFCRTKASVDVIGKILNEGLREKGSTAAEKSLGDVPGNLFDKSNPNKKIHCRTLHADLTQAERDLSTRLFRNGSLQILVATDLAARGLDVEHLELVINFDLPSNPDIYIHRIGRTGRAGRRGVAVSIATEYEAELVKQIESATGIEMIRY